VLRPWLGAPVMSSAAPLPLPSTAGLLDEVNKAIVEQLQKDGRRTYGSIAEAVGLSEAAVRQRVQKMRDAGIMQIVAVTDPLQVGFRSQAMVGIRAYDILVELVCEDDDHMLDLLNGVIRQIPGVRSTEMFMYLKLKKQTYTWGTR